MDLFSSRVRYQLALTNPLVWKECSRGWMAFLAKHSGALWNGKYLRKGRKSLGHHAEHMTNVAGLTDIRNPELPVTTG